MKESLQDTSASSKVQRFLPADCLRGVAILIIVLFHILGLAYFSRHPYPWDGWNRSLAAFRDWTDILMYPTSLGWAGVSLFFVISGFCIHASFLRQATPRWGRFFWQRFWRIYPPYAAALLLFSCWQHFHPLKATTGWHFWSHAFLIHNGSENTFFTINASFWSIATEVQLYLLYPLLLWLRSTFGISKALAVTACIGLVWRLLLVVTWGLPASVITSAMTSPAMTWFDWSLGAYIAECHFRHARAFTHHALLAVGCGGALILSSLWKPATLFSFSLAALCSAIVLDWLLELKIRRGMVATGLATIGTVSYSLYLWHQPLLLELARWLARARSYQEAALQSSGAIWLAVVALLLALSAVSYWLLERPSINLGHWARNWWLHRISTSLPVPAEAGVPN